MFRHIIISLQPLDLDLDSAAVHVHPLDHIPTTPAAPASSKQRPYLCRSFLTVPLQLVLARPGLLMNRRTSQYSACGMVCDDHWPRQLSLLSASTFSICCPVLALQKNQVCPSRVQHILVCKHSNRSGSKEVADGWLETAEQMTVNSIRQSASSSAVPGLNGNTPFTALISTNSFCFR